MTRVRDPWMVFFGTGVLLMTMAALPCGASAQAGSGGAHWAAALGLGARPDYEGSDRYKAIPVGFLKARWDSGRYVEFAGTESSGSAVRISGNLISDSPVEFGPILQYRLGRGDVQSNLVDAMKNVDAALEGGVFAAWAPKPWRVELDWAGDMSHTHDGSVLELSGGYADALSPNLDLGVTIASTWASKDYNDTYFGVSARDSGRSGLDTFNASSGFKDVGGRIKLGFAGDDWGPWKVIGTFAYFRMIGDAADSPVVARAGDDNQYFFGVALAYQN